MDKRRLDQTKKYVSRAGLKLESVAYKLKLDFNGAVVLDIGSSTGGFTDFALQHGAVKVIAVELGTNQLHPSLQADPRIDLHEKTDIRDFKTTQTINLILADVSFISLTQILPTAARLANSQTLIVAMVKPQFEAEQSQLKHKGVIKNNKMRRQILKDFEDWTKSRFMILDKADSDIAGSRGNVERFYLLKSLS